MEKIGGWAFLIGVILAVILGALGKMNDTTTWILVVIGLIVGLINITEKEATPFMMAGAVLVVVSALSGNALSSIPILGNIFGALMILFVPATVVVAVKTVFGYARSK